jgi:hypothetical protein
VRPHWLDAIQPGDVIRFKSGALRTALIVMRSDGVRRRGQSRAIPKGFVWSVQFPILHCSWTTRGHTGIHRWDLIQRAECITRARINLEKYPTALALIDDATHPAPKDGAYHADGASCCDVIGVFS